MKLFRLLQNIVCVLVFCNILFCKSSSDNSDGQDSGTNSDERTKLEYLQLLLNAASAPGSLQPAYCITYSMPLNWLYFLPAYYYTSHADLKQYQTVIIGDSSMDYSSRYPGFMGVNTQSVAVQGNKVCDMVTQLPAINTVYPQNVVVSTMGGNDIFDGVPNIEESHRELFNALKERFPSARIIAIGIPPSKDAGMNSRRSAVNNSAIAVLQQVYQPSQFCYVDPEQVLGNPPNPYAFLDDVHYSPVGAFAIKTLVQDVCGLIF